MCTVTFMSIPVLILAFNTAHCSLVPRSRSPRRGGVWHTSSHFLVLLNQQFRILDYQSDSRHVTLASTIAISIAIISISRGLHVRSMLTAAAGAGTDHSLPWE